MFDLLGLNLISLSSITEVRWFCLFSKVFHSLEIVDLKIKHEGKNAIRQVDEPNLIHIVVGCSLKWVVKFFSSLLGG